MLLSGGGRFFFVGFVSRDELDFVYLIFWMEGINWVMREILER